MRNTLLFLSAVAVFSLGIGKASADVFVFADIDKLKLVNIVETITVTKTITLAPTVTIATDKSAESEALINQTNIDNFACTNCDEKTDTLKSSVNGNTGITTVNQAAGNMNNQANAISVAVDTVKGGPPPTPPTTGNGFTDAQASVEQNNGAILNFNFHLDFTNILTHSPESVDGTVVLDSVSFTPAGNTVDSVNIIFRSATIDTAVNNNTGVTYVNQSPGNMNNQSNALSLAISLESSGVALAEADLGQINVFNTVFESDSDGHVLPIIGIHKTALITGSVNGNIGVVGVNQSAGNMANQANVFALSAVGLLGP